MAFKCDQWKHQLSMTSSCGRLFDAVSALLNLCTHSTFEAEAPMRLENIAAKMKTENIHTNRPVS